MFTSTQEKLRHNGPDLEFVSSSVTLPGLGLLGYKVSAFDFAIYLSWKRALFPFTSVFRRP